MNPNLRGEDHASPHTEPPDPPRTCHCWRRSHSCERSRQESAQGTEGPDQGKPPPKKGPKPPPGPPPDGGRAQPPTAWSPPRPGSSRKTSSPRTSSFSWPPKVPLEVDLQCRTARGGGAHGHVGARPRQGDALRSSRGRRTSHRTRHRALNPTTRRSRSTVLHQLLLSRRKPIPRRLGESGIRAIQRVLRTPPPTLPALVIVTRGRGRRGEEERPHQEHLPPELENESHQPPGRHQRNHECRSDQNTTHEGEQDPEPTAKQDRPQ